MSHKPSTTTTTQLPPSPGASSSALRPQVSRMRSRGRSITSTDPAVSVLPPSSAFGPLPSTSSSNNPSNSSPNLLPSQQGPYRNRAPTLSLALPTSQLSTVLEPDTPDKPFGPSHDGRLPGPSASLTAGIVEGVRSRSSSVGQLARGASSIVVNGEVTSPGAEGGAQQSRGETSASGRVSMSNERPSSSLGISSSSSSVGPGTAGWAPAERILHGSAGRALGGRVQELFRSSTSAGKSREPYSPTTPAAAARRWAGERTSRDSFSDEEEGRSYANRGGNGGEDEYYFDEEDGASLDGSQAGSESSLNIKLHSSQIYLPLPYQPQRRPTLTFTAPPPNRHQHTPPHSISDSPVSFSPTDPSAYFYPMTSSLPTPALSSASLSAYNLLMPEEETVVVTTTARGGGRVTGAEIASLARGMIPTLVGIVLCFVASLGLVVMLLTSLPIPPSLQASLPKSASDIRLLSSSITDYMGDSRAGLLHTLVALGITGVWTHAWSVPGSVVLNILIGALLPSIPAVLFLTMTTTVGGLCSYLLSRPLSPIITLLFPTQLAIVRSSIASGGAQGAWRKLLVMRATGLVPWSGMNVACGVVGVRWQVFCATFAAGSLSWNYVTSQIGSILMRISSSPLNTSLTNPTTILPDHPSFPLTDAASTSGTLPPSESLTSLLRDPTLIAKLVGLSILTLLPLLLKPKTTVVQTIDGEVTTTSPPTQNPWLGVWIGMLRGGGSRLIGQTKRFSGKGLQLGREGWSGLLEVGGWGTGWKNNGIANGSVNGGRRGSDEEVEMREGLLNGRQ